jgi:hypothetical protein
MVRKIEAEIAVGTGTGTTETVTVAANELGSLTGIPAETETVVEIPIATLAATATEVAGTTGGQSLSHETEIVIGSESVPRRKAG